VGVSSNALAKICNRLLVPYPPRGYWAKKNVGREPSKPSLPPAPDPANERITIGKGIPSASRRARTRLDRTERQQQLIEIAERLIEKHGLHAATMKQIAAQAGISETQAYNYFRTREHLLVEMARRVFAHIREARERDLTQATNHYDGIMRITRTYLREIGHRGSLLQTVLSSAEVRTMLRSERSERQRTAAQIHAQGLVERFGVPFPVAFATTNANTAMSLRAGRLIAAGRISIDTGERLCLAMMLRNSLDVLTLNGNRERAVRVA
jgi:AcrR family transcriptional regulator